ncbi:MAG: toprim domain-containing protein, partial [bacterium]|nr:toprim domain-containing protein [bacterium]
ESKEVRALIIALGAAIAEDFDIEKLRYQRIIIMTDADVDGSHIRTLLLTLFYRYFKPIIERGYLYIAQPPLYRIQAGKQVSYAYTDVQKEDALKTIAQDKKKSEKVPVKKKAKEEPPEEGEEGAVAKISGVTIQRYKGLGEMNPEQLWETTMDPAHRVLLRVGIDDGKEADKTFDILMGDEVLPRKKFIQTHAKSVKNLDI